MHLINRIVIIGVMLFSLIVSSSAKNIVVLTVEGVINQSSASYIDRGIKEAEKIGAECIIIELDTPGGLLQSTEIIYKRILNSYIPVIVYVSPKGAKADSAGVFVAISANVVAMAPGTSIGAAHPVDVAGKMASEKITSAVSAIIRGIAQKRDRNPKWAESAVRKSKAVTEKEALKIGICDVVAYDINELVEKLDNYKVLINRAKRVIHTKNAKLVRLKMSTREKLLQIIGNPNVAYVLFTFGMLGIIYEFSAPGFGFPGVVGGVCIILALYSFHTIGPSLAGLLLLIFAVLLFILDIKMVTHGILSIGGAVSFVLGSLMIFSPQLPYFKISLSAVGFTTVIIVAFFMFIVTKGILAQKAKVISGEESLIGRIGEAKTKLNPNGRVYAGGEEWSAVAVEGNIPKGAKVEIIEFDGVIVKVKQHIIDNQ